MPLACSIKTPFNATELSCAPVSTCASRAIEKEIQIHSQSTAIRSRYPLRLDRGEGKGEVSISIHICATGIHIQSTAIRNRAIAADIRATRIYIRATIADSREIGITVEKSPVTSGKSPPTVRKWP